jgi:hypothetical protein
MVDRAMTAGTVCAPRPGRTGIRATWLAVALVLARICSAAAFPFLETNGGDQVPQGTELGAPAVQDLQHQLQLVNGFGPPVGGGWTIVPRFDWQEELTDNVLQVHSPRRSDLISYFSPGIDIAGDLPRVQLTLDVAPTLALYARTGDLNSLTEQLNALGSITLVPDFAFVDLRAISGVQSAFGGLGGQGTIGAPAGSAATAQTSIPNLGGNAQGLNKNNEFQTSSFGISPYLLQQFGDWGSAKLGDSFNVSRTAQLSGFFASPFPTGGINAQTLVSNEENAHFATGNFMEFLQDSLDVDAIQSRSTTDTNGGTTGGAASTTGVSSSRFTVTDQVNYVLNRSLTVFASGGHEDIVFSNQNGQSGNFVLGPNGQPVFVPNNSGTQPPIHDLTWSLGGTWTPNPDSALTLSYGHQNGFNSFTANGHYAATARTMLTVSYGSTLGTQLENVQNQLNLASTNGTGTLVNGQNGGQLFGSTNALAVQNGVFRTDTLTVGSQTWLDRDIISINLLLTKQTSAGGNNGSTSQSKVASVNWLHQMTPDMTLNGAISYSIQDQTTGTLSAFNPGNNTSLVTSLAWQWQISGTVSTSLRYSFLERQSSAAAFDLYQNILILGVSKRF